MLHVFLYFILQYFTIQKREQLTTCGIGSPQEQPCRGLRLLYSTVLHCIALYKVSYFMQHNGHGPMYGTNYQLILHLSTVFTVNARHHRRVLTGTPDEGTGVGKHGSGLGSVDSPEDWTNGLDSVDHGLRNTIASLLRGAACRYL